METIHLKTVDPVSQTLLQSAATRGIDLNWERYEKLQPPDGFLRVGLSCPYGCMQGPCRIDPFARGAELGICGLDRDRMVAALLLRLCLNGVFDALNDLSGSASNHVPSWPESLEAKASQTLATLGGQDLEIQEAFQSAASLHRPGETAETLIRRTLRLSMLTLALQKGNKTPLPKKEKIVCRAGYGLLAGDSPLIGICGHPSAESLTELVKEAAAYTPAVGLVSLGDWITAESGYLPFACTSGEAELVLSSGRISLVLCGPSVDPCIPAICEMLKVPVILSDEPPEPLQTLRSAVESHSSHAKTDIFAETSPVEESGVVISAKKLAAELKNDKATGLVLIGGTDTPQQSLGWIATEVAPALGGEGYQVAGWGDAALWMVKRGLAREENDKPVRLLHQLQGPLETLAAVTKAETISSLKGICYTGLNKCQDLAAALGLASLGARVCVASPLPLWGSKKVRDCLTEFFADHGGVFTHYDHPADANEILQWFRGKENIHGA
jgi:hypothetical protein